MSAVAVDAPVEALRVAAYTVPTGEPESDGTFEWNSTTIVVVELEAGGQTGLGYTYGHTAAAALVDDRLRELVVGADPMRAGEVWVAMGAALRNIGRPGVGFMAVSAVDTALWDLKARLLDAPLVAVLGAARTEAPLYGSGGFTSYTLEELRDQLSRWVAEGIPRVKIKVSRHPDEDPARLDAARAAIGDRTELFVDSNGALDRKQAVLWAERFASEWDVTWFEEPVSSADFEGLRLVRDRAPGGLEIAAGEYAFVPADFRNLVSHGCVDCLQADATRCGGFTGFLQAAGLCTAYGLDLSAHCAPQLHAHALCAAVTGRHVEYFHDHVRVERLLFDGVLEPDGGALRPDRSRAGHGLELKRADAERFAA
jgi:L-alanine-DL-glutamate epimerase-like enolase superfamily enzyme